jgi:hypothetical protein
MTKTQFLRLLQRAIREDGRGAQAIADQAGVTECNIRTVLRGHCPDFERSDAILTALGRKVTMGRGKRLDLA